MTFLSRRARPGRMFLSISAVIVSIVAILLVSYRALGEWQRTATALAQRRAEATVDLLVTALLQDMRAVQTNVLSDQQSDIGSPTAPRVYDLIASAFATYPYPEVFFRWGHGWREAPTFYLRSERAPSWLPLDESLAPMPIATASNAAVGQRLLERISHDARVGRRYSTFDLTVDAHHYQAVAWLSYGDVYQQELHTVFGFLVDLDWVHEHYFRDLTTQVVRISGADAGPRLAILDGRGRVVVGGTTTDASAVGHRHFPVLFFDPRLVAIDWPDDLSHDSWTAFADIAEDPVATAASRGAFWAFNIAALMGIVVLVASVMILRAARASSDLADIRADFVATVTHELKAPLTTIQAISETFAAGRAVTEEISRKYGRFSLHEAKRLRRLIDNLLAYSRVGDVADVYSFERLPVHLVVEETIADFASQLDFANFTVHVDVPPTLPALRADRRAIGLALGNVIDNAIRYSSDLKQIEVTGRSDGRTLAIAVSDRGIGIPSVQIPLVTRKFFTGARSHRTGSGLGLAIVDRIITDHSGRLTIQSHAGLGTTVTLTLPAWGLS